MKTLKKIMKIIKNEAGQVLPMALVLLLLGGFLIIPTLSLVSTGLKANVEVDQGNLELYAADAGVENILWNMQYNQWDPKDNEDGFTLPDEGEQKPDPPVSFTLNDREVQAVISKTAGEPYYRISCNATNPDDGHQTELECLCYGTTDYSWFFESCIISAGDVKLWPGTDVTGDVLYDGQLTNQGQIDGQTIQEPSLSDNWPSADELIDSYYAQVDDLDNADDRYPTDQINISGSRTSPTLIPRLYRQGSLLLKGAGWARLNGGTKEGVADAYESYYLIDADGGFDDTYRGGMVINTTDDTIAEVTECINSGKLRISKNIMASGEAYTIRKNGLVYVAGETTGKFAVNPLGSMVIDLNGQTIFSEYDNECSQDAILINSPGPWIRGSGCFIAVGNVTFQPNLSSSGDKLIGVDYTTSFDSLLDPDAELTPANTLVMTRFKAEHGGTLATFSLLGNKSASGNIKLAVYSDSANNPGTLLTSFEVNFDEDDWDEPVQHPNDEELWDIELPEMDNVTITKDAYYWLAAVSDTANIIGYKTYPAGTCTSRTKTTDYDTVDFTDLTNLDTVDNKEYLLAGNARPFLFVMSIECASLLQPNGDYYGSIAGTTDVYLKPGCELALTDVPEDGLVFPNPGTGSGEDTLPSPVIKTYAINPE